MSNTLVDLARQFLTESDESASAYLRQGWLSAVVAALREARRQANLTQQDVAQRLGTTQSVVARLESDHDGRMSLHRYIDYALACDTLPLEIVLEPISAVRDFALSDPDAPRTQKAFETLRRPATSATTTVLTIEPGALEDTVLTIEANRGESIEPYLRFFDFENGPMRATAAPETHSHSTADPHGRHLGQPSPERNWEEEVAA